MNHIEAKTGVFLLTVETLESYEIVEYYGIVAGKAIYGANFVKDFFARVADKIGGRVGGYEKALAGAMDGALTEMAKSAKDLGANAVIGVDVKTGAIGALLMSTCTGTAVRVQPSSKD